MLDALQYFDLVEIVSTRPFWYDNGCTTVDTFNYLRTRNPDIKLFGVFHAYGFNNPDGFNVVCHPNIRQMWEAYHTANLRNPPGAWYTENWLGNVLTYPAPLNNQVVLNWSDAQPDATHDTTDSLPMWWAEHVNGADFEGKGWDGAILEAVGVPAPSSPEVLHLDACVTFPFGAEVFDYVFSEHMIEHISYAQGKDMLRECFRVLKPMGKLRVATPDLKFLIELYALTKSKRQEEYTGGLLISILLVARDTKIFL